MRREQGWRILAWGGALIATALVWALALTVMTGCGGGGVAVCTGAVQGWVYVDGDVVVICDPTPPSGYHPAVGATVRVIGVEGAETTTDENGHYYIGDIPPGVYTIEIIVEGYAPVRLSVPIIAGRITCGSGHTEGGGGII